MKSKKSKILVIGIGSTGNLSKLIEASLSAKLTVKDHFRYKHSGSSNKGLFPMPPPCRTHSMSGREYGWYNQFNQVKRNNNLKLT